MAAPADIDALLELPSPGPDAERPPSTPPGASLSFTTAVSAEKPQDALGDIGDVDLPEAGAAPHGDAGGAAAPPSTARPMPPPHPPTRGGPEEQGEEAGVAEPAAASAPADAPGAFPAEAAGPADAADAAPAEVEAAPAADAAAVDEAGAAPTEPTEAPEAAEAPAAAEPHAEPPAELPAPSDPSAARAIIVEAAAVDALLGAGDESHDQSPMGLTAEESEADIVLDNVIIRHVMETEAPEEYKAEVETATMLARRREAEAAAAAADAERAARDKVRKAQERRARKAARAAARRCAAAAKAARRQAALEAKDKKKEYANFLRSRAEYRKASALPLGTFDDVAPPAAGSGPRAVRALSARDRGGAQAAAAHPTPAAALARPARSIVRRSALLQSGYVDWTTSGDKRLALSQQRYVPGPPDYNPTCDRFGRHTISEPSGRPWTAALEHMHDPFYGGRTPFMTADRSVATSFIYDALRRDNGPGPTSGRPNGDATSKFSAIPAMSFNREVGAQRASLQHVSSLGTLTTTSSKAPHNSPMFNPGPGEYSPASTRVGVPLSMSANRSVGNVSPYFGTSVLANVQRQYVAEEFLFENFGKFSPGPVHLPKAPADAPRFSIRGRNAGGSGFSSTDDAVFGQYCQERPGSAGIRTPLRNRHGVSFQPGQSTVSTFISTSKAAGHAGPAPPPSTLPSVYVPPVMSRQVDREREARSTRWPDAAEMESVKRSSHRGHRVPQAARFSAHTHMYYESYEAARLH